MSDVNGLIKSQQKLCMVETMKLASKNNRLCTSSQAAFVNVIMPILFPDLDSSEEYLCFIFSSTLTSVRVFPDPAPAKAENF